MQSKTPRPIAGEVRKPSTREALERFCAEEAKLHPHGEWANYLTWVFAGLSLAIIVGVLLWVSLH